MKKVLGPNPSIEFTFDDFSEMKKLKSCLRPNTKFVWLDTPTNPVLKVFDIEKIAKIAHDHGAMLIVDNTFPSPVN